MKKFLTFVFCLFFIFSTAKIIAQTVTSKFEWVNSNTNSSSKIFENCNNLELSLTTSNQHRLNTSNLFPLTSAATATRDGQTEYSVTLNFSAPVSNVKLKISDIDQEPNSNANSNTSSSYPEEVIVSMRMNGQAITSLNSSNISGQFTLSSNEVHPTVENAAGWLIWNGTNINSVSFTIRRYTHNYGIMIDELEFTGNCGSGNCCDELRKEIEFLKKEINKLKKRIPGRVPRRG